MRGAQLVQEIFEENPSPSFQGAVIWTPMLATDNLTAATKREKIFTDSRARHFWDSDCTFGRLLAQTLKLKVSIAWDVYLLYPPEHDWDAELPPAPKFWMHQLNEEPTLYLDPDRLKRNSKKLIDKFSG